LWNVRQTTRKPYPAYKPSGVEWLGDVLKHWQGKKLKFVSAIELSNVDKHTVEGEQAIQKKQTIEYIIFEILRESRLYFS
jgi:type I restriction enzyme S subunit